MISLFELRNCNRKDFEIFNATDIYDNLDTIGSFSDINRKYFARYCFDIPENETFPEYGGPDGDFNATFFN